MLCRPQIKAGKWYDADGTGNRAAVTSYHEVVGFMTHPLLAAFALLVVIVTVSHPLHMHKVYTYLLPRTSCLACHQLSTSGI